MAIAHNRNSILTLAQALIDADAGHLASRVIDVAKGMTAEETLFVSDEWQWEIDKCLSGFRSNVTEAIHALCAQRNV